MRELTVGALGVRALMELAVARGACRTTLAERSLLGAADLSDPDARIPFSKYVALMRAGQQLCDDPALALHFGETVDVAEISVTHGVGAASFGDAVADVNRFAPLGIEVETDGSGERFQLRREAGAVWLVDGRRNPNAFPELTESSFARMVCTTRRLFGDRPFVRQVHFTHAEPSYRAEYDRIFQVPLVFGSTWNALQVDESVFSGVPWPTSSPYVANVIRGHAESLLQRLESSRSLRERIEHMLLPMLEKGEVSMGSVASSMCLSRQTLFRKLKTEGVTFEQVLDELRHKLALNYLTANKASVKETARLVGYSDPAAFSRAFKRWTGYSPRDFVTRPESAGVRQRSPHRS